jgi:hypothetical protein
MICQDTRKFQSVMLSFIFGHCFVTDAVRISDCSFASA